MRKPIFVAIKSAVICLSLILCLSTNFFAQGLDVQAVNQAKSFFSRMYKRCGEYYYYKYRESRWHLYQCKYAPTVTVNGRQLRPNSLSEADRLNGVDPLPVAWEGSTRINLGLCRQQVYINPVEVGTESWSSWTDVNNHGLDFKNVKGEWQFYNEPTGREMYTKDVIVPVACEDVPDPNRVAPINPPRWEKYRDDTVLAIPANYPDWYYVGTGPMKISKFCQPCSSIWIDGTGNARSVEGAGSSPQALAPNALLGSVIARIGKTGPPFQLFPPQAMSNYDGYTIDSTEEIYVAINDSVFTDNRGVHGLTMEGMNLCINCASQVPRVIPASPSGPVSGGVLNGKATSLPKPIYPPAAANVRAEGNVSVQVIVDEKGHVISASAVNGHPLLRPAAAAAALGARFSPTLYAGQPVKVSGVITYNFVAP